MPTRSRERAAQADAQNQKPLTEAQEAARVKYIEDGKKPHHVKLTAEHGKGAVTYMPQSYRSRDAAERAAKGRRQAGYKAEVILGKLPQEALPGSRPGDVAAPTDHTASVRKAAAREPHPCKCGCGTMVPRIYAQGHDAKHVSKLAERYRGLLASDRSEKQVADEKRKLLAEVSGSDRLTAKLARSMELIDQKAAA